MKLLFTNNTLSRLAGTELAIRDLCLEMRRRGHEVAAYSPQHGEVAGLLQEAGIPVLGLLEEAPFEPDVIHGHHQLETTLAALRWPRRPVISFCRGLEAWQEEPCTAPNVVLWTAVDEPCRQRLLSAPGVRAEAVRLVLNGIDLARFPERDRWRAKPEKALVFSNYATESNFGGKVMEVCRAAGLQAEIAGAAVRRPLADPGMALAEQDVVFAKGKAALEALACGAAVVVCDERGLGPLVTRENFARLRGESFGYPCMTEAVTAEGVTARLAAWDPQEVEAVAVLARATGGSERMFDELESLYQQAAAARVMPASAEEWASFASKFWEAWIVRAKLGREVWGEGEKRDLIEPFSAGQAGMMEAGHNRMLDRLRKGLGAIDEAKAARKKRLKEQERKTGGFWARWKTGG